MKRLLSLCTLALAACVQSPPPAPEAIRDAGAPATTAARLAAVQRYDTLHHPVPANGGMVVSQNALASKVGQQVLRDGGNAVDAAVAVGFALAVTLPRAGNIGGSGFMLIHNARTNTQVALDFRSTMPAAFDLSAHTDETGKVDTNSLKFGAATAGVPGTVAGLYEAWERFGSLPFEALVQPAVALAANGIPVTHDLAFALAAEANVFARYPGSREAFMSNQGSTPELGAIWRQPQLAWSLAQIRDGGADAFYRGAIAERLIAAMERDGGYMSREDLAGYQVREREPLRGRYRGRNVVTMPPVSGGGVTLLQMLHTLDRFDLASRPQGSAASLHLIAEVMKQGAANRRFGIGDPDFSAVPTDEYLAASVTEQMASAIDLNRARAISDVTPLNPVPPRNTTHYSVVDAQGNAVSTTYTLGYSFGGGYVADGTGFLLDNQMRNFSYGVEGHANGPAPGKRMMSTMTPTFVYGDAGDLALVTGTPGGSRIINVILQVIVNVVDYGMNVAAATNAPRIHQPWRSQALQLEPGISPDTRSVLEDMGHTLEPAATMGSTQSIELRSGLIFGAADPRRPGALAAGVERVNGALRSGEEAGDLSQLKQAANP